MVKKRDFIARLLGNRQGIREMTREETINFRLGRQIETVYHGRHGLSIVLNNAGTGFMVCQDWGTGYGHIMGEEGNTNDTWTIDEALALLDKTVEAINRVDTERVLENRRREQANAAQEARRWGNATKLAR